MGSTKKSTTKPKRYHISSKDREYLIDNLALLLKSGVPVGEALQSLKGGKRSQRLNAALDQMLRDIDEGVPLWKALERSNVASEQTLALAQLGEQSGKLVDNLRVAAAQEEKQRLFRSKVRSALIYPAFVMVLTIVVGLSVAWFLLPRLSITFSQLNAELPLISKIFIGFGDLLSTHGLWLVPLTTFFVLVLIYILFWAPRTKFLGQQLLFKLPGVSRLLQEVETARFGYLLGTLLEAGLSITQSFSLLAKATSLPQYKKLYADFNGAFENGYSFRASLSTYAKAANKLLPSSVQQMIIAGEKSGALSETLKNIGDIYEQKVDISTRNLESILEPILLVIVWLGVLGVAIAVILPIYSLIGGLSG